jgi:hypothetical protein
MAPLDLSLIPFLALGVWRFRKTKAGSASRPRQSNRFEQGFHFLDSADLMLIAGDPEGFTDGADLVRSRARIYLHRIVTLTGATQKGNCYFLDVDKTRFCVRGGHVTRIRDVTDPKCEHEETCYYSTHKEIPRAEQIATVLLQLKNNPALFDGWAAQGGLAFKADGQVFNPTQ